MRVGIITIDDNLLSGCRDNSEDFARRVFENGLNIVFHLIVSSDIEEIKTAVSYSINTVNQCFVTGNVRPFIEFCQSELNINTEGIIVIDGAEFIAMQKYDKQLFEYYLPLITGKQRPVYSKVTFKTFGLKESDVREMISDYLKNRNRIMIKLYPSLLECDVVIRYSNNMAKRAVDDVIMGIENCLGDHIYANEDISLAERAMQLLKYKNCSLAIAESFTGGLLTSELIKIEGASKLLFEGLVCYSNDSKVARLGVEPRVIAQCGAVSVETVYEMAAGMLSNYHSDYVLATSGNAGPSAEKEGDVGRFFLAVGTSAQIEVFKYHFPNLSRIEVMQSGVKSALYHLIKLLDPPFHS